MRMMAILICVSLGGCSSTDRPKADVADIDEVVAPCINEEVLREYNVTEEEIRQFKDETKAKADAEAMCN